MPAPPRRLAKADPFDQEIEAALQPGSFIKYGASWSFIEGLERVEQKIAKLIRSAPARAAVLYETFLAGCHEKAGSSTTRAATSACSSRTCSAGG